MSFTMQGGTKGAIHHVCRPKAISGPSEEEEGSMGEGRRGPGKEFWTQVTLCAVLQADKGSLLRSCLRTLAAVSITDRGSQQFGPLIQPHSPAPAAELCSISGGREVTWGSHVCCYMYYPEVGRGHMVFKEVCDSHAV